MWSGLRLRILLLLGAFLLLAFAPLYFAISTFANVSLKRLQAQSATRLLKFEVTAIHRLEEEGLLFNELKFQSRLKLMVDAQGIAALALRPRGQSKGWSYGSVESLALLPESKENVLKPGITELEHGGHDYLILKSSSRQHRIYAVTKLDSPHPQAMTLLSLLALYMAVGGAALLFVAYLALTHWIVRPIVNLAGAAARVERGGTMSHALAHAPSELLNLSHSLVTMTQQLRQEEVALRTKIEELEAKKLELASAQNSLIRSERLASVGHLAAGLAHEVGNPLSALLGILELLAEGGLSAKEQQDFILRMKRETERIHQVMNDLLTFARSEKRSEETVGSISRDGRALNAGSCDPNWAIEEVFKLLKPQKKFLNISLITELAPSLRPVAIRAEELVQVLLNLLLNAGDACPESGTITVRSYQSEQTTLIELQDDGPGVDPAYRQTLFEPFVTSKDVGQGTGLGLSVSQGLLVSSGGTLELIDTQTSGALFRITLPS